MPRGTSVLEFAVENFPNNASHAASPEDQFLWEDGALRNSGEIAMDEILFSYEGGLETGGSRLFVGNLTIHSEASRDHRTSHGGPRASLPARDKPDLPGICQWSEKSACLASWIRRTGHSTFN